MLSVVKNEETSTSTSTMQSNFIAVDSDAAREAGAIVHFRCMATDSAPLEQRVKEGGLDAGKLPDLPSAEVALHRAVDEQKAKRRLVRPVEGGGWAIVDEHLDDAGKPKAYSLQIVVRRDPDNGLLFEPSEHPLCGEISASYVRHRAAYAATDISMWLVRLCERHDGVSPRDRGGFYFIPKQRLDAFRTWAAAVHAASGSRVFFIPAMKSDEAIEAILDAITREAEGEAESMEQALNDHADALSAQAAIEEGVEGAGVVGATGATSPNALDQYRQGQMNVEKKAMGMRAIGTKLSKLRRLGEKLGVYEDLLNVKLDVVRERLERVRAGLTVASLAVEDGGKE